MERVRTLINKLQEQLEEGVETGRLLITTQMLLVELQQQSPLAISKVSVIIPAAPQPPKGGVEYLAAEAVLQQVVEPVVPVAPEPIIVPEPILPVAQVMPAGPQPLKMGVEYLVPETVPQDVIAPAAQVMPPPEPIGVPEPVVLPEPVPEEKPVEITMREREPVEKESFIESAPWLADTINNVAPTLIHQPRREAMELNDTMVAHDESINDRLREKRVEVATLLQSSPVKDLRKAIGINDRYLFINELFRGDEAMYERSLKTINSYSFLPEAEYWIQRELKIKLGWDEDSPTVQHFDQLVKRRFF